MSRLSPFSQWFNRPLTPSVLGTRTVAGVEFRRPPGSWGGGLGTNWFSFDKDDELVRGPSRLNKGGCNSSEVIDFVYRRTFVRVGP